MTTASAAPAQMAPPPTNRSSILLLLRLEGLVVAVATAAIFARTGASWWLFALWLAPDLSMLGYLAGSCQGARIYNAFHNYIAPGALALCSLLPGAHTALPLALIWANHIGVDRLLGFGLKYGDGFSYTHLSRLGKQRI